MREPEWYTSQQPFPCECLSRSGFEVSLEVSGGLFARKGPIPRKGPRAEWLGGDVSAGIVDRDPVLEVGGAAVVVPLRMRDGMEDV
jgi:hypothetical protein